MISDLLLKRITLFIFSITLLKTGFSQYANTTLSNLTPPTAVNTNLLPATSSGAGSGSYIHLGSSDKAW